MSESDAKPEESESQLGADSESQPAPTRRSRALLGFRIALAGLMLAVVAGYFKDRQARQACGVRVDEFFFLLQGPDVGRAEVHALMKRPPDVIEERSRWGDLVEDYVWSGVFFNYTMRLIYSREYGLDVPAKKKSGIGCDAVWVVGGRIYLLTRSCS